MKKMIKLAVLLAAGMALFSCSNSTQSSSTNNGNNEIKTACDPYCMISFKINGKQCFQYGDMSTKIFNNEDYSNSSAAAQYLKDKKMYSSEILKDISTSNKNRYQSQIEEKDFNIYGFAFENIFENNISKEAILTLFPSDDGKIRITDIKINMYFADQFYSGCKNGEDEIVKQEKNLPEYYIKNNLGYNDFVIKDGTIEGFIIEGKRKENTGNHENPFEWDESVPLKKVPVSVSCKYFEPENIWKNKNNFNNLQNYIYKYKMVVRKDDDKSAEYSFEIDLKKDFWFSKSYLINDEDVIF